MSPSHPSDHDNEDEPAAPEVARRITRELLRRWPLPVPDGDDDKEERGRVLIIGGSAQTPGGLLLAATAALRAGAGKLQLAVGRSLAPGIALALPEARVFALPETESGALSATGTPELLPWARKARALLIGPGMVDEPAAIEWVRAFLPHLPDTTVVLDAAPLAALTGTPELLHPLQGRAILTPHAGETAALLGMEKQDVCRRAASVVRQASERFGAVMVLKGAETLLAAPGSRLYRNVVGNVGLATSGSGDVLAGIVAGLAARGAEPIQAAVWGVYLHAAAGDRLAERVGPLGYLARELPAEVPGLMRAILKGGE